MVNNVLCVAEKPSIAKAVANHLGGGQVQAVSELTRLVQVNDANRDNRDPSLAMFTPKTMNSNTPFLAGELAMSP